MYLTYHRPQKIVIPKESWDFSTDDVWYPLDINNMHKMFFSKLNPAKTYKINITILLNRYVALMNRTQLVYYINTYM